MKRILIVGFIFYFFILSSFSQNGDHVEGRFSKTIEYNLLWWGNGSNLNSKGEVEKLFFGDFNAPVEFFFNPSPEYPEEPSGFRIIKDTLKKTYILEIKWIPNFREALKEAYSDYPMRGVSSPISTPKDTLDQIGMQNRENIKNASKLALKLFTVDTRYVSISNSFAEKLYKKMVSFIDNFKARGVPHLMVGGAEVTFRTVVDDEVWCLNIQTPFGNALENALKMSIICSKIIKDGKNNQFDEASYVKLLDDF